MPFIQFYLCSKHQFSGTFSVYIGGYHYFSLYTLLSCSGKFLSVRNESEETQIPEILETEEEKGLSIGQPKYNYLQIARQKFQGKVFTNKDTQNPIRVSRDGIME